MKEIDAIIDNEPTESLVAEIAELRIRNLDAFRELQSLNDSGYFLYVHPLIKNLSLRAELETLLKKDSKLFLKEYSLVMDNEKRYRSFLKDKRRSNKQKEKDQGNLKKYIEKRELIELILEENK